MPRASKVCSTVGCPETVDRGSRRSRCNNCERNAEQRRGSAHSRGYTTRHRDTFRTGVLARHPICVLCRKARSEHADHYPLSRRELVAQGANPNNPEHGRGLCHSCHSAETAKHQPGGWHANH